MNIDELLNVQVGEWVNDPVEGRISSAKNMPTKKGTQMSIAKLGDGDATIDIQSFDTNLLSYEGKYVVLSGGGMKRDEYNGYPKLKLGKATQIGIQGGGAPNAAPTPNRPTKTPSGGRQDDDFVPQTLTYLMGAALHATLHDADSDGKANEDMMAHYAVAMYNAREKAVAIIREGK